MESRQYQFRANPEVEAMMKRVWLGRLNTSANITRIIKAGCAVLQKKGATDE